MSNNQFYIPEELSKSFNDIPTERSDYYPVFKHWWNTGVDAIREDNSAIEAKRLVSGLANITTLTNDLEDQIQSRITKLRQKQEEFVNQITDESGDIPTEIVDLWQKPTVDLWGNIEQSLKVLNELEPSDPDEPFTSGEFIYHRVKRMKEVFKQVRLLYAKYLGMAKLLTFYWDYGQLLPYEEARSNDPIVSWEGIKNISIKQLLGMAHSAKYAAYIRFMFYREEKQFSVKQAYDTVLQEVKELNVSFDYTLPYEPLNLNKAAKYHIKNLRSEAGKENKG